jgi:transcriptional regulator with XRE-family HTH domain
MDEESINKAFGARLGAERKKSLLTQEELSRRVGIGRTTIANIERGRQSVSIPLLYRLASALGVAPEGLLPQGSKSGPEVGSGSSEKSILSGRQNTWVQDILQESQNDEK